MENLNPCNIQRSLGEIRCLFCFVYLTLIVFFLFCFFCSCTSCFLRNKNGLWLLKLTPICQGGEESFGLNWKIFIFFCKKKRKENQFSRFTSCRPARSSVWTDLSFLICEFCFSFGQEGGPEASSCPAVLGDVDPCWGVYECVMFTLFALMYITMSKILKIYFE